MEIHLHKLAYLSRPWLSILSVNGDTTTTTGLRTTGQESMYSSYIEPMDLVASPWTRLPSSPCLSSTALSPAVFPARLYPLWFFIMQRVSPKAHLSVLSCVLIADLAALPLLRWQLIRLGSKSQLFRQPQTWTMILKCALDFALVSLLALDTSKRIDNGKHRLANSAVCL